MTRMHIFREYADLGKDNTVDQAEDIMHYFKWNPGIHISRNT